jgi:16S rRNA C967 or C1407 C5-methylase (RsmB/RsmF family)/NOL1/NOP2/fmu family ribosome biogenesis protein
MPTLPPAFVDRINVQFGDEAPFVIAALGQNARTSVLINPAKSALVSPFDLAESVAWNKYGFLLKDRPAFTLDPRLHGGHYYVQESSSMMIAHVLQVLFPDNRDITCFDLCAAPGGKSLNILNHLQGEGLLVSNEVNPLRNSILRETLCKWGSLNKVVTKRNTNDFAALNGLFDFVLVDAPCSGEGMFRKDDFAVSQWSPALVKQCASTQANILQDAWALVSEGGYLAFSTCTFAPEENVENATRIAALDNCEAIRIPVPDTWNLSEINSGFYGLQFLPHKVPGEGFFISVFRKISSSSSKNAKGIVPFWKNAAAELRSSVGEWVNLSANERVFINTKNEVAVVSAHSEKSLKVVDTLIKNDLATEPGLIIATVKGRDFIPEHGMAMNTLSKSDDITVDISTEMALDYLRRDLADIPTDKLGWLLLRSEGVVLGWVKKMNHRINNYYPVEWRVKRV